MNIEQILKNYDSMFGKYSLSDIEIYLYQNIEKAKEQSEIEILFTLLNEMIGLCRDTTQKEKGLFYCEELLKVIEIMGLKGRVEYATALINIANAYRAFGLHQKALEFYDEVLNIYNQYLEKNDFYGFILFKTVAFAIAMLYNYCII